MASKTKTIIIANFLELVSGCEYEKISVTDLVEKCGISRQTFYYHFDDIKSMLEWSFNEEIKATCQKIEGSANLNEIVKFNTEFVEKYIKLFKSAIKSSEFVFIFNQIKKFFVETATAYFIKRNAEIKDNQKPLISFWSNAMTGYVVDELQKDNPNFVALFELLNNYLPRK